MTAARQPVPRRRAPRVRDDQSGPPWPSRAWYLILLVLVGASASCSSTGAVANAPLDSSVSPMPAASVEPLTGSAEASLPTTAPSASTAASTAASAADYNCPSYTSTIDQVRTTHGGASICVEGGTVGFRTLVVVSDQYDGGRPQTIETTTDVDVEEARVIGYDHTDRKNAIFISSTEAGYMVDGKVEFADPVVEVIRRGDIPPASGGSTTPTPASSDGGSRLQPSSIAPTTDGDAVTFDTACEAVPLDAQAVLAAGQAYKAGQLSSAQLQQLLANLTSRWTPLAKTRSVVGDVQASQTVLAARMVSQFETSSFQAAHHEEPIIVATEWTAGELGTDYRRSCGTDLPR